MSSSEFFEVWLTTGLLALVSALVALTVGIITGYWLAGLKVKSRRLVQSVLLVPFLLPAFLVGGLFIGILGREQITNFAFGAVVVAHVFMNIGFVASLSAAALSSLEREQLEVAQLAGATPFQTAMLVELPQLRRALASAGLLIAVYSSTSFGLVLMLAAGEIQTLETAISQAALQRLDLVTAGWLALGQVSLTLLMVGLAAKLGAVETTPIFGSLEAGVRRTGKLSSTIGVAVFAITLSLLLLQLLGSLRSGGSWQSAGDFTLANFANLSGQGGRDILNLTLFQAGLNSLRNLALALAIALPLAWLLSRPGLRTRAQLLLVLPLGVSPLVLGLAGLVLIGLVRLPFTLQWLVLPVFQAVMVLPLLVQLIAPARVALDPAVIEAAEIDGAGRWRKLTSITVPLLRRPLAVAGAIAGLSVLGEFGAASFLSYGSQATISVSLGRLLSHPGAENLGMFSAAAAVFILVTWLLLWVMGATDESRTGRK